MQICPTNMKRAINHHYVVAKIRGLVKIVQLFCRSILALQTVFNSLDMSWNSFICVQIDMDALSLSSIAYIST